MATTTSDLLIDRLLEWGVSMIFGYPGDGNNGIMEALRKRQEKIRFVQVRHEEGAAFMACAYAKFTGKLGVCLSTSGPGAVHLLNGLYDAKLDLQPVLAITGQTYHDLIGTGFQQEIDILALYHDVAVFSEQILGPEQVNLLVDSACRSALARRGVAHLVCPVDVQDWPSKDKHFSMMNVKGKPHTTAHFNSDAAIPRTDLLKEAAEVLNDGKKVAMLVGQGALGAGNEVEQLAELLAAPVVKALLGKAVIPDDSPYTTGGLGLVGTLPSEKAMEECDTLLMVGSNFPYVKFLPEPGKVRAVQIDRDAERIGMRVPIDVGLTGDARATIQALMPLLKPKTDRSFLQKAQERYKEWLELMDQRESRDDVPLKPQRVVRAVSDLLADDAILTTDCGTITTWTARHIRIKRNQKYSLSGTLATMAPGLPYANAAQLAYPGRQVVAVIGDGGFTMLMQEFLTTVKYELPIKVVIIKNGVLGQIMWEQMVFLGNPEFGIRLQTFDFVRFAEACGAKGFRIEQPGEIRSTMEMAFKTPGPVIVEAVTDPYEPPMPAQAKPKQALHMAEALARGEPNATRIGLTLVRDKVRDYAGK
ncbi:MAG TPA: thiamine pyrophosphate-dependent enzyme [Pirellulales bacterium]|nr:thiamine pyrophosphate-dependent enzyme [Pirellulales bacterium]